jgi:TPR repeat protein
MFGEQAMAFMETAAAIRDDLDVAVRRAAESGHAEAQFKLAVMLATGHDVMQNLGAAAEWYRRAAGQGHVLSCVNLAEMYAKGLGVSRDPTQARAWINRALTLSSSRSLRRLTDEVLRSVPPETSGQAEQP